MQMVYRLTQIFVDFDSVILFICAVMELMNL